MTTTEQSYDYLFKFLLRGDSGVGKTSFLIRYADGTYTDQYISTIGVDFKIKTMQSPDTSKSIKLQIWDTAGRERYRGPTSSQYRGSHGVLVFFDCTDRVSFQNVKGMFDEIDRYASENVQKILVATKIDMADKRLVSYEEAKQLADHFGVPYIETSAKNNININETIQIIARNIERMVEKQPPPTERILLPPRETSRCLIL